MTGKIRKRTGVKRIGFMAGLALIVGFASSWLTPCSGMDAMTQSELSDLSGQDGISMAFMSPNTYAVKVVQSFTSLCQGDTDGWGSLARDANPGWIILIGTGSNTGYLTIGIPCGTIFELDVGTTGGTACSPGNYSGWSIPANTSFVAFSLTDADIGLQDPETVYIRGGDTPTINQELIGQMNMENLAIDKATKKSTCYIWAHDASVPP